MRVAGTEGVEGGEREDEEMRANRYMMRVGRIKVWRIVKGLKLLFLMTCVLKGLLGATLGLCWASS
jgi:hypothetical protein